MSNEKLSESFSQTFNTKTFLIINKSSFPAHSSLPADGNAPNSCLPMTWMSWRDTSRRQSEKLFHANPPRDVFFGVIDREYFKFKRVEERCLRLFFLRLHNSLAAKLFILRPQFALYAFWDLISRRKENSRMLIPPCLFQTRNWRKSKMEYLRLWEIRFLVSFYNIKILSRTYIGS